MCDMPYCGTECKVMYALKDGIGTYRIVSEPLVVYQNLCKSGSNHSSGRKGGRNKGREERRQGGSEAGRQGASVEG